MTVADVEKPVIRSSLFIVISVCIFTVYYRSIKTLDIDQKNLNRILLSSYFLYLLVCIASIEA